MSRLFPSGARLASGLACAALLVASEAAADWPTDPAVNLPVSTANNTQALPAIATDMAGGALITWMDARGGVDFDIYAQHVLASGIADPAWPVNGRAICTTTGDQVVPTLVSDGSGGAIVAWEDRRVATTSDIYAHHIRSDGTLDPAWPANGLALCTAAGLQYSVKILSDGAGGALAAWQDNRNDTDIFAARVLANGQLDPTWPVNGVPIASGPGAQKHFGTFVTDGQGGLIVAFTDTRNGPTPDIYAQHLRVSGSIAPGWPVNGIAVCTATGAQNFPSVAEDGVGGAFVAWEDLRGGPTADIYVQHIRPNGTPDPAWPVDGRAACTATGNQTRGRVLRDAHGGAFVAWIDARAGSVPALYAQHLLADGSLDPAWPSTDLDFCAVFGNHSNLMLLPDGSGGALAVWNDFRGGQHVYAHHLLVQGSVDPGWPVNGRGLALASGTQVFGRTAIADGSGGLIAAWTDSRPSTTGQDIYAQRVQANGQLGGTVVDVPRGAAGGALALAPVAPTPSRSGRLGVRYNLPRDGAVSLELLDVAGRRLASRDLGEQSAGPHTLDWEPGIRTSAGLQFLRLRFGRESRTIRAITLD